MPSVSFVLPHALYWAVLVLFPLIGMYLANRERGRAGAGRPNLFLAYLFWLTAGFVGMHRFYLHSALGFLFIPLFLGVLWSSAQVRDSRELVSRTRVELDHAERVLARAKARAQSQPAGAEDAIRKAESKAKPARTAFAEADFRQQRANTNARIAAILLGLALLVDAVFIPGLVRQAQLNEPPPAPVLSPVTLETGVPELVHSPAVSGTGMIDTLVRSTGEFVSYWAVLAVFAYYYEVIVRYIFNSPTNWVHESMFLMFGIQYMLAGAYAYRDDSHVRVDVLYAKLSLRGRAICDVITSTFFFIFITTMLVTGWKFASDAIAVNESSFTEWGIQYWPVKLSIPIGAALLLLQGFVRLLRDINVALQRAA